MKKIVCVDCGNTISYGNVCNDCGNQLLEIDRGSYLEATELWNESIGKYVLAVDKLLELFDHKNFQKRLTDTQKERLNRFKFKCLFPEMQIALVGTIKAGKSTLINALIGKEFSPVDVNPKTAVLTKFRSADKRHYLEIKFYSASEWEQLIKSATKSANDPFYAEYDKINSSNEKNKWLGREIIRKDLDTDEDLKSELDKWVSSDSIIHYFIKEVEVGVKEFGMPKHVVLVDTPGLDDPFSYRSDITRNYIDSANAVLVCIKANALTLPEIKILNGVFSNSRFCTEKIIVVATQIDILNNPLTDWNRLKNDWVLHLSRISSFGNPELASKNIVGVSAYFQLLINKAKSNLMSNDEMFELKICLAKMRIDYSDTILNDKDEMIKSFTAIEIIKEKLHSEIIEKFEDILLEEIKEIFVSVRNEFNTLFQNIISEKENLISMLDKDNDELSRELNRFLNEQKSMQSQITDLLNLSNRINDLSEEFLNSFLSAILE